MTLSSKEWSELSNIIFNEQSAHKSFEASSALFHSIFSKSDYFKVGKTIVTILKNDLLTDGAAPVVCLYLLWDMYKHDSLERNPFLPFILAYVKDENSVDTQYVLPIPVKKFMHALMVNSENTRDLCQATPLQLLTVHADVSSLRLCDWSAFEHHVQEHLQQIPKIDSCGASCVLPDDDTLRLSFSGSRGSNDFQAALRKQCIEALANSDLLSASSQSLRPEFLRLTPPLLPCPQAASAGALSSGLKKSPNDPSYAWVEELIWLNPTVVDHDFHWDYSMGHSKPNDELINLMSMALTSTLNPTQQQTLIQSIKEVNIVQDLGLTPENFPSLVNENPVVAIAFLDSLKPSETSAFLSSLLTAETTTGSMEVLNRVATQTHLPSDYICTYISKCISNCRKPPIRKATVRIVCLLIQAFVRNKQIDVQDGGILHEVQSFCLEFSEISDASALYRIICSIKAAASNAMSTSTDMQ